jgi:hypothetical protein
MVGPTGIEPATYRLRAECSTRLSYEPEIGGPRETRTLNLRVKGPLLYAIELATRNLAVLDGFEPTTSWLTTKHSVLTEL